LAIVSIVCIVFIANIFVLVHASLTKLLTPYLYSTFCLLSHLHSHMPTFTKCDAEYSKCNTFLIIFPLTSTQLSLLRYCIMEHTVKLLINAGSPINAGSLLNAGGGYLSNVQINAGSPINAGSLINAGSPINAGFQSLC